MDTLINTLPPGYLRGPGKLTPEERARLRRAVELCQAARPADVQLMRGVEELTQEERLALRYFRDTLKDLGLTGRGLINSRSMRGRYRDPLDPERSSMAPRQDGRTG